MTDRPAVSPLAILIVIDGMHPRSGGPPAVVVGSAIALAERGHRVTILTTAGDGDEAVVRATWATLADHDIALTFCAAEGARGLIVGSRQRAMFERLIGAADVVHLHGIWNPVLLIAGRIARRLNVPYFASVHGVFDRRAMGRVKTKLVKKRVAMHVLGIHAFLDHAAGIIFGSAAEAAQSWIPSRRMRTIYVPNGVAERLGTTDPTAVDLARLTSVAPATATWTRTLLCRSRIHPEKGIDMLVAAFGRVAPAYPAVGLLIAGMRQDEPYEARLRTMIAQSPVADRILMTTELTGPTSQFLYRACDLFVMPSIAEGFSMALIEGLANARPLLITRYCHMPVVEEVGAGLVVDPDMESIAAGLRDLLARDASAWAEMGAAARRLFAENYTWDHVAQQLEREYSRAAAAV